MMVKPSEKPQEQWENLRKTMGKPWEKWQTIGKPQENIGKCWFNVIRWDLASGYVKVAIESGPAEIVSFPIENSDVP